jgi:hypothetical protein
MTPSIYGRRRGLLPARSNEFYYLTNSNPSLFRTLPETPVDQRPDDSPLKRGLTVDQDNDPQPTDP